MLPASSLCSLMRSREVHQNTAHQLCRNSKEVRPVLPTHRFPIDESEIGFVNKRCRLKRVIQTLTRHVVFGEPVEFLVDERRQLLQRLMISIAPCKKQLGDFVWIVSCR